MITTLNAYCPSLATRLTPLGGKQICTCQRYWCSSNKTAVLLALVQSNYILRTQNTNLRHSLQTNVYIDAFWFFRQINVSMGTVGWQKK